MSRKPTAAAIKSASRCSHRDLTHVAVTHDAFWRMCKRCRACFLDGKINDPSRLDGSRKGLMFALAANGATLEEIAELTESSAPVVAFLLRQLDERIEKRWNRWLVRRPPWRPGP